MTMESCSNAQIPPTWQRSLATSPHLRPWAEGGDLFQRVVRQHHSHTQQPIQKQDSDDFYHFLFTTEITIGTPSQPLFAGVDISWSDLFVPSSSCTLDPNVGKQCIPRRKYNSTASSTYTPNSTTTELFYYFIGTQGQLSQDILHIGGLSIDNQTFEEATHWETLYPPAWSSQESALGLARLQPKFHSMIHTKSPLQDSIERKILDRNIFSLKLPRTDKESSELTLGGYDESKSHSLTTLPLTNVMHGHNNGILFLASCGWQVSVSAISLSASRWRHQPLNISLNSYTAIISNSVDYISLPWSVMKQFIQHLGLDERDDLDCVWHAELPDLTVSFGDHGVIVLTPRQYLSQVEDWNKGTRCVLPFSSMYFNDWEEHETDWIILGTPFLQSLYSVFDIDNEVISLAIRED